MRPTWTTPTHPRKKLTAASLASQHPFPLYHKSGSEYIQVVLGGDDHAPASPDAASGHQGTVLSEGELLGRAAKVGDTGDDKSPLVKSVEQHISIVRYLLRIGWIRGKGFRMVHEFVPS